MYGDVTVWPVVFVGVEPNTELTCNGCTEQGQITVTANRPNKHRTNERLSGRFFVAGCGPLTPSLVRLRSEPLAFQEEGGSKLKGIFMFKQCPKCNKRRKCVRAGLVRRQSGVLQQWLCRCGHRFTEKSTQFRGKKYGARIIVRCICLRNMGKSLSQIQDYCEKRFKKK